MLECVILHDKEREKRWQLNRKNRVKSETTNNLSSIRVVGTVYLYETAKIQHPAYTNCIDKSVVQTNVLFGNNLFVENLPSIVYTHKNWFDDAQSIVSFHIEEREREKWYIRKNRAKSETKTIHHNPFLFSTRCILYEASNIQHTQIASTTLVHTNVLLGHLVWKKLTF